MSWKYIVSCDGKLLRETVNVLMLESTECYDVMMECWDGIKFKI